MDEVQEKIPLWHELWNILCFLSLVIYIFLHVLDYLNLLVESSDLDSARTLLFWLGLWTVLDFVVFPIIAYLKMDENEKSEFWAIGDELP